MKANKTTAEIMVSKSEIQLWLVNYLADFLEIDTNQIEPTKSFSSYGLNSLVTAGMASDLAEWLGKEISPDSAYQFTTIEALATYLSTEH